jgi:hypothetical protein
MTIISMISLWIYTYMYVYIFTLTYFALCIENIPGIFLLFINFIYELEDNDNVITQYKYNQYEWNQLLLEWI